MSSLEVMHILSAPNGRVEKPKEGIFEVIFHVLFSLSDQSKDL